MLSKWQRQLTPNAKYAVVLILVLMEYALEGLGLDYYETSQALVLILVLMEYALEEVRRVGWRHS